MTRLREKVWVVRPGDGWTVAGILSRMGDDPTAVTDGRVFVGKKRVVRADQPVRPGDSVRVARRAAAKEGPSVEILFERDGLVATIKPAGIPTVPDHAGASHSFVALVAEAIGVKTTDLRVTSRLDRDVSGVIVFARDEAAETRLRAARAEGRYRRRYIALASGALGEGGTWDAAIGRAESPRLRAALGPEEKPALTQWARVAVVAGSPFMMLAVEPITGRTHQIRVHASHAGAPLLGDLDYGGTRRLTRPNGAILSLSRIALHAARVIVPGPAGPVEAHAPVPAELRELWTALGGHDEAWSEALRATLAAR